jgi:hypothetical protein
VYTLEEFDKRVLEYGKRLTDGFHTVIDAIKEAQARGACETEVVYKKISDESKLTGVVAATVIDHTVVSVLRKMGHKVSVDYSTHWITGDPVDAHLLIKVR